MLVILGLSVPLRPTFLALWQGGPGMATAELAVSQSLMHKSPVRKLAVFFEQSRDRWKAKYRRVKTECRAAREQVRAVEKSRQQWAERAAQAERQILELGEEVGELQKKAGV